MMYNHGQSADNVLSFSPGKDTEMRVGPSLPSSVWNTKFSTSNVMMFNYQVIAIGIREVSRVK